MSDDLISHSDDLSRLVAEGFEIEIYKNTHLIIHNIPYLNSRKKLRRGTLICALTLTPDNQRTAEPGDHTTFFKGEVPCHVDGTPIQQIINNSNHVTVVDDVSADHYFSAKPEGSGRYANYYDKIVAYEGFLGRPARHFDKTANGRTGGRAIATPDDSPFSIPDTASARYKITALKKYFVDQRVGIVGLGGTGSYVLDLVAKTPVREIHLFDGDQLLNHNLFRSPGMPIEQEVHDFPTKVEYYHRVYDRMHSGIIPHAEYLSDANIDLLRGLDFVFLCVDDGPSREVISRALFSIGADFVDTGIGVGIEDDVLDGVVRATTVLQSGPGWDAAAKFLPFGKTDEDEYDADIQIADLNCVNAALAVLRWKRKIGFYRDHRSEMNSNYMIEGNMLANRQS